MSLAVQSMFAAIASRYDLANAVLSFGVDGLWRRRAVRLLAPRRHERILDACCGTADLALLVARRASVVGLDFSPPMLERARRKAELEGVELELVLGSAMETPFEDGAFDAASMAFGVRNLDDPVRGLRELRRVVRPGGRIVVLEFGRPSREPLATIYRSYSQRAIPALGERLTGQRAPYEHLIRTAEAFPCGEAFLALMRDAGLAGARAVPLTFGVAYAYRGEVPGR